MIHYLSAVYTCLLELHPGPPSAGAGALAGAALLLATGCAASPGRDSVAYEMCRAEARIQFHADADKCADAACIEARAERLSEDLRGCR